MSWNQFQELLDQYGSFYLNGALATIVLSIVGTFGGLFFGIFLAFGKSLHVKNDPWYKKIWKYPIKGLCQVYSAVIRGTPMMVQAMIFKYGCQFLFNLNWEKILPEVNTWNGWMIAGLIVITLNTTAYMGEIVQAGLNGVDKGQIEGAKSLGMNDLQILWYITLPQAIKNAIPTIGNEWIVNIKDSSVLNVIGVTELYWYATRAASSNFYYIATYLIIAVIYLCMTLAVAGILKYIAFKMSGKKFTMFHFKQNKMEASH